jgi:hypothetical protein
MKMRRRGLSVSAIGATIAMLAIVAPAPRAGAAPQAACTATSGVTVIVDFSHFHTAIQRGCAPGHPASALAALHAAGFDTAGTAQYGDAFLCRINGLPTSAKESCTRTPPASSSWSFYRARPTDTAWTYSSTGVTGYQPPAGSLLAFAFGNYAKPGIGPSALLVATMTSTSAARTTVAPVAVQVLPPAVTPPTATPTTSTSRGPAPTAARTIPASKRPVPRATTATATAASTMPQIDERAAAPRVTGGSSGSPLPAALTVVLVVVVGAGGLLTIRARRRRL